MAHRDNNNDPTWRRRDAVVDVPAAGGLDEAAVDDDDEKQDDDDDDGDDDDDDADDASIPLIWLDNNNRRFDSVNQMTIRRNSNEIIFLAFFFFAFAFASSLGTSQKWLPYHYLLMLRATITTLKRFIIVYSHSQPPTWHQLASRSTIKPTEAENYYRYGYNEHTESDAQKLRRYPGSSFFAVAFGFQLQRRTAATRWKVCVIKKTFRDVACLFE